MNALQKAYSKGQRAASALIFAATLVLSGPQYSANADESAPQTAASEVDSAAAPQSDKKQKGKFRVATRKRLQKKLQLFRSSRNPENLAEGEIVTDKKSGDRYLAVEGEQFPLLDDEPRASVPVRQQVRQVSAEIPGRVSVPSATSEIQPSAPTLPGTPLVTFLAPPTPEEGGSRPVVNADANQVAEPNSATSSTPNQRGAAEEASLREPLFGTLRELRGSNSAVIRPMRWDSKTKLFVDVTSLPGKTERLLPPEEYSYNRPILVGRIRYLNSGSPETWIGGPFAPSFPFPTNPLYFEDPNLERCGLYACSCCWQPVSSAAHFFGNVAAFPFKMLTTCPSCCVWPLADCAPGCRYSCCENFRGQLQTVEDAAACGIAPPGGSTVPNSPAPTAAP